MKRERYYDHLPDKIEGVRIEDLRNDTDVETNTREDRRKEVRSRTHSCLNVEEEGAPEEEKDSKDYGWSCLYIPSSEDVR